MSDEPQDAAFDKLAISAFDHITAAMQILVHLEGVCGGKPPPSHVGFETLDRVKRAFTELKKVVADLEPIVPEGEIQQEAETVEVDDGSLRCAVFPPREVRERKEVAYVNRQTGQIVFVTATHEEAVMHYGELAAQDISVHRAEVERSPQPVGPGPAVGRPSRRSRGGRGVPARVPPRAWIQHEVTSRPVKNCSGPDAPRPRGRGVRV